MTKEDILNGTSKQQTQIAPPADDVQNVYTREEIEKLFPDDDAPAGGTSKGQTQVGTSPNPSQGGEVKASPQPSPKEGGSEIEGGTSGTVANTNGTVANTAGTVAKEEKKPSYVEMYKIFNPFKPKTAEEIEADRRKERREKTFSAISDGISALSNLYFTTKGAPSSFDPSQSLSGKARERYRRLQKEYDDNMREYQRGYMLAQKMDEDANYRDYLMQLKSNEDKRKEKAQEAKDKYNEERLNGLIEKNKGEELKNERMRMQNELAQETNPLRVQLLHKQIAKADKAIEKMNNDMRNSNARTHKYVQGGGSNGSSRSSGKGDGGNDIVYTTDENGNSTLIKVPKGFIAKNRAALARATDVYVGGKNNTQIDAAIMQGWNEECTKILQASGGKTGGSSSGSSSGSKPASKGKGYGSSSTQSNGNGKGKGKGY